MEQQLQSSTDLSKILCPHCLTQNACFEEIQALPDVDRTIVHSYMCISCGYTSTTLNVEGSNVIKHYEETTAELIKDLRWLDPKTNLVWYPIVLNFPSYGIIFPDGTNKHDWKWKAAPAVDIPEEEQKNFPIPHMKGSYYTRRVDMSASKVFEPHAFHDACVSIGFIQ